MSLSIVFPAYDEESKIEKDIENASEFLYSNNIEGEIIVVDDGSTDKTYQLAVELKNSLQAEIEIIKHNCNQGKGFAVRSGILKAKSDFILYSDTGNIVPLKFALKAIELLNNEKADIVHGSRKLHESIIIKEQDSDRKLASWVFNKLILGYLNVPGHLTDTQCGFKIYRKEIAKQLYSELQIGGFLFEIEIIIKAVKNNFKILEFPVEWKCDRDSRISIFRTTPEVLKEINELRKMKN